MLRRTLRFASLLVVLAPSTALAAPDWKFLGPAPLDVSQGPLETPNMGPTAGRASALAVDPTDPNVLYAGFAQGGVWKSIDDGTSWKPIFDGMKTLAIGSVTIDPSNHDAIWIGTGEAAPYAGRAGLGLFVSTDGGATFGQRGGNLFDDKAIAKIRFDGPDVYLAVTFSGMGRGEPCTNTYGDAAGQGLYRTSDLGQTFTLVKAGAMTDIEIDASVTPHRLFVSDYDAGAFKSDDGGATWQALTGLPAAPSAKRIELTISEANPAYVYAGLQVGNAARVYVSKDHGATFVEIAGAPNYCESQCYYDNAVLVDPTNPDKLYLGGALCGMWGSTNATAAAPTWTNLSTLNNDCGVDDASWYLGYVHVDIHSLTLDPSNPATIYASTDGGLARSKDSGATWERLNAGIGTLQLYGVCVDPNDASVIYGGSQDNGVMKSAQGSLTWRGLSSGDGGPCAVDAGDSKIVLTTIAGGSVFRSTNAFASVPFSPVFSADPVSCTAEPGCGDRSAFIAPLIGDPSRPHTFYVGTQRLWKSSEGGTQKSWKAVSPDLTAGAGNLTCSTSAFGQGNDVLSAIAVSRTEEGTLYTGSQAGVLQRTTDGGATWTRISKAPLPERYVSGLAVDPLDSKRIYAAFSGFSSDTSATPGHVFRSADGGDTWILADTPGDEPIDSLLAHPFGPGLVYAGTESGVLASLDAGATWQPLGDGLPHSAVYSLAFQEKASTLVVGTHGRSIWSLTFASGELQAAPESLAFTATFGGADPAPQTVVAHDTEQLGSTQSFTANADVDWITGFPVSGGAAGGQGTPIAVTVSIAGLEVGGYDGTVVLTGPDKNVVIPVHLEITTEPVPVPVPTPTTDAEVDVSGSGCACRVEPARRGENGWLAMGLVALALTRKRRR